MSISRQRYSQKGSAKPVQQHFETCRAQPQLNQAHPHPLQMPAATGTTYMPLAAAKYLMIHSTHLVKTQHPTLIIKAYWPPAVLEGTSAQQQELAATSTSACATSTRLLIDTVQAKVARIADLCNHPIPTAGTAWCTTMPHVGMHRSEQTASNCIRSMKDCPLVL